MLPTLAVLMGEGRGANFARFWQMAGVASDDGDAWSLTAESDDAAPAGLGGEALFTMAYITVRAGAGAVLRITPIVNGNETLVVTTGGATYTVRQPLVTVPQQGGTPEPMVVTTFEVPLLRTVERASRISAFHLRGERCRIRIESVGSIGSGAFRLEQCELEHEILQRSAFATFTP